MCANLQLLAETLRDKAEDLRKQAEKFKDSRAKRLMLEVADQYIKLAKKLEDEWN